MNCLLTGIVAWAAVVSVGVAPCPQKTQTAAVAATTVVVNAPKTEARKRDIVGTAVAAGKFKALAAALEAADLVEALQQDGPFTVFAPTDEAFAKIPKETLQTLLKPENQGQLAAILTYHVVAGEVRAADVAHVTGATTLNGQRIDVAVNDGNVSVDKAGIVATDIECTNGVIHIIDTVMMPSFSDIPETASKAGTFNTLLAAAGAAGLADVLKQDGPFTVFAPTDKAFAKLPEGTVESLLKPENKDALAGILKYHVVSGRIYSDAAVAAGQAKTLQGSMIEIVVTDAGGMVNNAKLVLTDLDASNGVIHVVDTVLLPPQK